MYQPLLSASHSENLERLLTTHPNLIQAIEFTPFTPLSNISEITTRLRLNYELFFHPGHWLRYSLNSKKIDFDLMQYLTSINPTWVSFHIYLKPAWVVWFAQHQVCIPLKRKPRLETQLIKKINLLKNRLPCPIMLELMPASAVNDRRESDPLVINSIIRETGSTFLLDIPHAIISAQMLGMPVDKYLSALPLDLVREVHISGMRKQKNGSYYDAHETIGEDEKYWLQWILDHCNPHFVNLEYYQNQEKLTVQLEELSKILNK